MTIEHRIQLKEALVDILEKAVSFIDFQNKWAEKRQTLTELDSIYSNEEANAEINDILDNYLQAREQAEFIKANGGLGGMKHWDGSDKSGHFGHSGRPNQVGGSLPTNDVTLSMIDDGLAKVGVRKGDVVKKFGLRKDVLMTHLRNRLEQKEKWRGVFKDENAYKEAVKLRDEMKASGVADDDKQMIKLDRSIARYEFIQKMAKEVEDAGGLQEWKLKQSGKTDEEIAELLGSGDEPTNEPEPVKSDKLEEPKVVQVPTKETEPVKNEPPKVDKEPEPSPEPPKADDKPAEKTKPALELSGSNLEKAKQIINHFRNDKIEGDSNATKDAGEVENKKTVTRYGEDSISKLGAELIKTPINYNIRELLPKPMADFVMNTNSGEELQSILNSLTDKEKADFQKVNEANTLIMDKILTVMAQDGMRRALYIMLNNMDHFVRDTLAHERQGARYKVTEKHSRAQVLGTMQEALSDLMLFRGVMDKVYGNADKEFNKFLDPKQTVSWAEIKENPRVKRLLDALDYGNDRQKAFKEWVMKYGDKMGAFNPYLKAIEYCDGYTDHPQDIFSLGIDEKLYIGGNKGTWEDAVPGLMVEFCKLGSMTMLDKLGDGTEAFKDLVHLETTEAMSLEECLNVGINQIKYNYTHWNKIDEDEYSPSDDTHRTFCGGFYDDFGGNREFLNEHFEYDMIKEMSVNPEVMKNDIDDVKNIGSDLTKRKIVSEMKEAVKNKDRKALIEGYSRLAFFYRMNILDSTKAVSVPLESDETEKTSFSRDDDKINKIGAYLESQAGKNIGTLRTAEQVKELQEKFSYEGDELTYDAINKYIKQFDKRFEKMYIENPLGQVTANTMDSVSSYPDKLFHMTTDKPLFDIDKNKRWSVFEVANKTADVDVNKFIVEAFDKGMENGWRWRYETDPEKIKENKRKILFDDLKDTTRTAFYSEATTTCKYIHDLQNDRGKLDKALSNTAERLKKDGVSNADELAEKVVSQAYLSYKYGIIRAGVKEDPSERDSKRVDLPVFDIYSNSGGNDYSYSDIGNRADYYSGVTYQAFKDAGFEMAETKSDDGMKPVKTSGFIKNSARYSNYSDVSNSMINTGGKVTNNSDKKGYTASLKTAKENIKAIFPNLDIDKLISGQNVTADSNPKDRGKYGKTIDQIGFWSEHVQTFLNEDGTVKDDRYKWTAEDCLYMLSAMTSGGAFYNKIKESNAFGSQSMLHVVTALSPNVDAPLYRFENRANAYRNYDLKVGDTVDFDSQHFTWNEEFSMKSASEFFGEEQPVLFKMVGTKPFLNLEQKVALGYSRKTNKLMPKDIKEYEGLVAGRTKIVNVTEVTLPNGVKCPCYEVEYDYDSRDTFVNIHAKEYAGKQGYYK